MYKLQATCHCQNTRLELELSQPPETYQPRACDCDFCRKHGAAYLSDPAGSLQIHVNNEQHLHSYKQGSGTADFLLCSNCGVLLAVTYQAEDQLYATVNVKAIDGDIPFGETIPVSPKTLATTEKTERWKSLWFPHVRIHTHRR
jgi:hypothetical protein